MAGFCTETLQLLCVLWLCVCVSGDLYLHIPRGSNNRLNEKTATRATNDRLFDSQNNARGGYNVGDLEDTPAGNDATKQYNMHYFQSGPSANRQTGAGASQLTIQWTNQHGCGGNEDTDPQKQNCNMVLQFMCEDSIENLPALKEQIRDGVSTGKIGYTAPAKVTETEQNAINRKNNNLDVTKGLQESWDSYDKCYMRERNKGLFIADQKVKNNKFGYSSATYTRQNPNGNRNGYECPEERDYFPYWHPTQWKDIAILAENSSMCSHYRSKSFNIQPYHECVEFWPSGNRKHWSRYNNKAECEENSGKWVLFHNYLEKAKTYTNKEYCLSSSSRHMWAVPYDATDVEKEECLVALETPDCYEAPWSRSNHLGDGRGDRSPPLSYTWTLPHFPSGHEHKCVFRMRYNISTDDYDPYNTDSRHNENKQSNIVSPVRDNEQIDVGGPVKLQMAFNTDQTGRIFQDRSHIFRLMPRPSGWDNYRIFNLNVRGKRGNIVQVYPAVEYDFYPTNLEITSQDLIHIQWTGSNTHNNNAPGGDGQTGDDGEGKAGSDRNNMAQLADMNENIPLTFEKTTMWTQAEVMWTHHGKTDISAKDLALDVSTAGYYRCFKKSSCPESQHKDYIVETKTTKLQNQLDNAPASYKGVVLKFKPGTYHYMCTRNNNFTNRSQKGTITVR